MRKRLSWDEEKVAEIMKQADPYTMNQKRTNPPVEKYKTGDPSAWGEDQNMKHPWESEGRTETGHPAPAREAVVAAKKLEDKALKCITIAQRMLPGSDETIIEDQATDFMFMPERAIMATLQRQAELAAKIAAESDEDDKKDKGDKEEVVEAKKEEKAPAEEEVVEAKKEEKAPAEEEVVEAKKEEKAPAEEEVVEAKKEEKAPAEEEVVEAKKKEKAPAEEEACEKEAADLLDVLFDNAEIVPEQKTGAKKLSGLVKQASSEDPLSGLWETPPDISSVFGKNR